RAEHAFKLFSCALVVGAACIVLSSWWPILAWATPLPLAVYALTLAWAQRHYFVALNATVKDSPYFLGFLLTMVALAKIFISVMSIKPGALSVNAIVGEAGAAIVP